MPGTSHVLLLGHQGSTASRRAGVPEDTMLTVSARIYAGARRLGFKTQEEKFGILPWREVLLSTQHRGLLLQPR